VIFVIENVADITLGFDTRSLTPVPPEPPRDSSAGALALGGLSRGPCQFDASIYVDQLAYGTVTTPR
jgi:hypothetical protein